MATREITNADPRLEEELIIEHEDAEVYRGKSIARLALLWQERRFMLRCAAIGMVISIVIVLLIPVRFTSTTRLMPPDQAGAGMASMLAALGKGSGGGGSDLGMIGSQLLGLRTSSDLFVGLLHSRTIQDQLVNKFDLRKVYGYPRYQDARKELERRTDVSSDRKSGIITIAVSDGTAERSAALAREYVDGLNNIVLNLNTSAAHKERVFLEERLVEVQKDLEVAEKDFGNFASKNTAIDVKEQGKAMIGAAAEIEGELIAAQTELEGLRQVYSTNNVRVRAVQAKVDEYQRQLQKIGGKAETSDSAASDSSETQDLYPSIRKLPIVGIAYADLYRRAKVEEAVYETLVKQYELAKVEEAREIPSVKVLDEGDVPERRSYPPRTMLVIAGVMLTFIGASLWILGRDRWRRIDSSHPGKTLLLDIYSTTAENLRRHLTSRQA